MTILKHRDNTMVQLIVRLIVVQTNSVVFINMNSIVYQGNDHVCLGFYQEIKMVT